MKKLLTKLLLFLAIVFGVSVAQAHDFYLLGEANALGSDASANWSVGSAVKLSTDAEGCVYFWANGTFKVSFDWDNSGSWTNFDNGTIKIDSDGKVTFIGKGGDESNSNVGSGKKYVKLKYTGDSSDGAKKNPNYYSVTIQDTPFNEGGGDEDPADLYIGGDWNSSWKENRSKITYSSGSYNDFELTTTATNQYFAFFTAASGGDQMGPSNNDNDSKDIVLSETYTTVGNKSAYKLSEIGSYIVKVTSYVNGKVTFTVSKKEEQGYKFYFRSNLNDANWKNDFELIPGDDGTTTFKLSNVAGKSFGIQGVQNNVQKLWYVPSDNIGAVTRSYNLTNVQGQGDITGHFLSNAGDGEYTFVLEWDDNGFPSQLRVNPPLTTSYNSTLFVGIASSNRHQIPQGSDGKYETYKFYVKDEDLINDGEFGFRFYSEPNGGVWMGNAGDQLHGVEYDKEYTTGGIKRYFIKETGAFAINVKSYNPQTNQVAFTISKLGEDEEVLKPLYIGGSWNDGLGNGKKKTRITSSNGKYQPLEITVGANCDFRFYSDEYKGNWMCPVYTNNLHVDAEGTMPYTTIGGDRVFTLVEAGTYIINVSEYLSNDNKVTFTVTKKVEAANPPSTLYIRNSKNWTGYNDYIPMTYDAAVDDDRNFGTFSATVECNANEEFAFQFVEKNAELWADRGIICYPVGPNDDGKGNVELSFGNPVKIDHVVAKGSDPEAGWLYTAKAKGPITVMVHFKKNGTVTVEVMDEEGAKNAAKNYYFIGDMNNWFSNEFDGVEGTDLNGDPIEKKINKKRWDAGKDNWKFEYAGDGWYRFTSFPNQLLTGHFQIVSGGSWDPAQNEVYSHCVVVDDAEIKGGDMTKYKAFKMNRITRDEIINGTEYRIRKRPSVKDAPGSNLGTQCNAVENAELWFNPGSDTEAPRIKFNNGTPKDYFIFYNMESAKVNPDMKVSLDGSSNKEYWVRAAINSGKPNTNNYFLAGIKYGDYTLPFYDINGNTGAHMNVGEGIDLAPYNLAEMTEAEIGNLFFHQKELVECFYTDGQKNKEIRLPNGRLIADENGVKYDKVWIAKIPSGFEDPAGTKYNMTFNKAMTEADRTSTRTITPRHYYFFPQEAGLHVHINTEEIKNLGNVADVEVAYRLYKTDNQYNTITVLHGSDVEGGRQTAQLHKVGNVIPMTANSDTKDLGWYECEELDKSNWGDPSFTGGYPDRKWFVSWINDGTEAAAETESGFVDRRREVAYDDNSAFVQFRMTIKLKQPINAAPERRNAPISSYTVYVPERPDVATDDYHFSFDNNDLYVKTNAGEGSDGVWTGLREVLDEIGGNVDPSSVQTVYYNLQGVRVDNPTEGGVYIRVRGDKSDKVIF